jgi:predicted ATPase/DNA-binding CsgD family transcriptional regulator
MSMRLVDKDFRARPTPVHVTASSDVIAMQLTSLVSRETEMAKIRHMLLEESEIRLLTLTGMGGIGKTRLALATAYSLAQSGMFTGGIYVISLATVREALEVAPRIAQALNISQGSFQDLCRHIKNYLNERGPVLLVLDNCETVLDAGSQLVYLMANCPQLKVLMTSRRAFRVRGEHEFTVPPLALPPVREDLQAISQYPAVQLFIERARAVRPDFALSEDNIEIVAKICQRLEGLPLAIELAAPRLKLLSLEALLARLEQRLDVLRGGSSDMPTRHQTMQASLEWSYELLSRPEKLLLQRLSIFAPSWSLEAVEAICADAELPAADLMDLLEGLVNHSLVVVNTTLTPPRYRLLEIIRQFATEKLNSEQSPEFVEALQRRHHEYYLAQVQKLTPNLDAGAPQTAVLELEQNYHNYMAALNWTLATSQVEASLRWGGELAIYWSHHNLSEGQFWLNSILEQRTGNESDEAVAIALRGRGIIAHGQGDFATGRTCFEEYLAIQRRLDDKPKIAKALNHLASAVSSLNGIVESVRLQEESLKLSREINDREGEASILHNLGVNNERLGDFAAARHYLESSLRLFQQLGKLHQAANTHVCLGFSLFELGLVEEAHAILHEGIRQLRARNNFRLLAFALEHIGYCEMLAGNLDLAESYLTEALALGRNHGSPYAIATVKATWARLANRRGDYKAARQYFAESVPFFQSQSFGLGLAVCLEVYAEICGATGEWERAVVVSAAADSLRQSLNMPTPPSVKRVQEVLLANAHVQLGDERYNALWSYGSRLSSDEVLKLEQHDLENLDLSVLEPAFSLSLRPPEAEAKHFIEIPTLPANLPETVEPLTEREIEVLQLLAEGLTNAQIAGRLIVSKHTVSAHLRSIFAKLNVSSRTAAARFAAEFKL